MDGTVVGVLAEAGTVTVPVDDCDPHSVQVVAVGPGGRSDAVSASGRGCVAPGPVMHPKAISAQVPDPSMLHFDVSWEPPLDSGGGEIEYEITFSYVLALPDGDAPGTDVFTTDELSWPVPFSHHISTWQLTVAAVGPAGKGPPVEVPLEQE